MTEDSAYQFIVAKIRNPPPQSNVGYSSYGYDIYLPRIIEAYVREREPMASDSDITRAVDRHSPAFMSAAWKLCLQNILRPGIKRFREQSTDDGSAGSGYSMTEYGREWSRAGA